MSNRSSVVVLDPGHGGEDTRGASSSNRAVSASGLLERDLVLDLARRIRDRLGGRASVVLTRDSNRNLSLADRARVARAYKADIFLSLHFNGDPNPRRDETVTFVARGASRASRALAQAVADRVSLVTLGLNRGARPRDLGVLLLERHDPGTASALVEIGHLTNPRQARMLELSNYRDQVAHAIAEAVESGLPASSADGELAASLGAPPFTITKSVGEGGKNVAADVEAVKRRLVSLGFDWITVDGRMDKDTIWVIRMFQSIVQGHGAISDKESGVDGLVSVPGKTLTWLQAPNAPRWQALPSDSAGFENFEVTDTKDDFDFCTDWLAASLVSAGARYKKNYLDSHKGAAPISLNDASRPHGQSARPHHGHQTGLMADLRLPKKDGTSGGINYSDRAEYDRDAARAQLKALRAEPLFSLIYFNDPKLIDEGLCQESRGHDNHFHFQIKPPAIATSTGLEAGALQALADTLGIVDQALDNRQAVIYSPKAPRDSVKETEDKRADDRAVWSYCPSGFNIDAPEALVYFHGNNNYVGATLDGGVVVPQPPSWAPKRPGKPNAGVVYGFDKIDGLLHQPIEFLPEVGVGPSPKYWATEPAGKLVKTAALGDMIDNCFDRLSKLPKPSGGGNYLSRKIQAKDLKRLFVMGHSGGTVPLNSAASNTVVLDVVTDLVPFDRSFGETTTPYFDFCKNWDAKGQLGNGEKSARFISFYGPPTPNMGPMGGAASKGDVTLLNKLTATVAKGGLGFTSNTDPIRVPQRPLKDTSVPIVWPATDVVYIDHHTDNPAVYKKDPADPTGKKMILVKAEKPPSTANLDGIREALKKNYKALFIYTNVAHDLIPLAFMPLILEYKRNP